MALTRIAAPTRPAPTPQPQPGPPPPPACAGVVVEAMLPVAARVASASAAILVLIDMRNSIRLRAVRCGPHAQLDGGFSNPVRIAGPEFRIFTIYLVLQMVRRTTRQRLGPLASVSGSNLSTSASNSQNALAPWSSRSWPFSPEACVASPIAPLE